MSELSLKYEFLKKELEYCKFCNVKYYELFNNRLKELGKTRRCQDDSLLNKFFSNLTTEESNSKSNPKSNRIKKIYKKLMLKYHTDKCRPEDYENYKNITVFIIKKYGEGDSDTLELLLNSTVEDSTNICTSNILMETNEMEKELSTIKNSIHFLWGKSSDESKLYYESQFQTEEEYNKKAKELVGKIMDEVNVLSDINAIYESLFTNNFSIQYMECYITINNSIDHMVNRLSRIGDKDLINETVSKINGCKEYLLNFPKAEKTKLEEILNDLSDRTSLLISYEVNQSHIKAISSFFEKINLMEKDLGNDTIGLYLDEINDIKPDAERYINDKNIASLDHNELSKFRDTVRDLYYKIFDKIPVGSRIKYL